MVNVDYIKSYVSYDAESGKFTRLKVTNDRENHLWRIGKEIGNPSSSGYLAQ